MFNYLVEKLYYKLHPKQVWKYEINDMLLKSNGRQELYILITDKTETGYMLDEYVVTYEINQFGWTTDKKSITAKGMSPILKNDLEKKEFMLITDVQFKAGVTK